MLDLAQVDQMMKAASEAANRWARTVAPVLGLPEADYQAWAAQPHIAEQQAEHRRLAAAASEAASRVDCARAVVGNDVT